MTQRIIVRGLDLGSAAQVAADRTAADASAAAAAASQTAAAGSATSAATSATAAQTARTGAEVARAGAEAARDDAATITGLTGEDAAIANRINTPGSLTDAALSAAQAAHINGFRDVTDKMRNQQQNQSILVVGDSTSDATFGGTKWTTGFAAEIGALFPYLTVYQHTLGSASADPYNWDAPTLIQTGTGYRSDLAAPRELHVWIAGWAAHNWSDWLIDARRDNVFGSTVNPDVVIIALGHNDGSAATLGEPIRPRDLAYIEWIRTSCPQAQIVLCSQNPRILTPGHAEFRNDLYRSLARERGYGYINITQAFHDDGRDLNGVLVNSSDQVHPTTAGYDLWRDTVMTQLREAKGAVPLPTSVPAFQVLTPRIVGMDTIPVLSNGWTGSNVNEAVETAIVRDGAARSIKLTKAAGGAASRLDRSVAVAAVKGRDITFKGWIYVPDSTTVAMIGVLIDGVVVASSLPDQIMVGQWYPVSLTVHVPLTAASVAVRLWVDNSTAGTTPSIYVDEMDVVRGTVPLKATSITGASVAASPTIDTWAASTPYSAGALTMFGGSLYQATASHTSSAAFRTDLAAGNWVHVGGHGRVESMDPAISSGYLAFPAALRAYWFRVISGGSISALGVDIGTQSGNILAGVYANNGSQGRNAAPGTKIADTGSLACPAVGKASLALGSTVGVAAGDWIMLAADNTTVRFRTINAAGVVDGSKGRVGYAVLGSLAAPASPTIGVWAPTYMPWVGGE